MEVFSAYPGPGPEINADHYLEMTLTTSAGALVFPPEPAEETSAIDLYGVKKGDVGCAVEKDMLKRGDTIECRGKSYVVKE